MSYPAEDRIKPEHLRLLRRRVKALSALIHKIRKYEPDANYYLEDAFNFYLLVGPSHAGYGEQSQQQNIAAKEHLAHAGGGGW